jgi:siroheme synthase (precorrin-2 oxidase/ferrochelatase)
MNEFDFKDRTAVITGGGQGFGLDIAKRFLNSGAKVIIWDIDEKLLKSAIDEVNNSNLSYNVVDVSNYKQIEKTVSDITAKSNIIDVIRSFAPGFIFTTSLPPSLAAAAVASIRYVKNNHSLREALYERANKLKKLMLAHNLPIIKNNSHIVPLLVKDPVRCKEISDILLNDYSIYVQPINYPTVPKGLERLRFTPTPLHDDSKLEFLVNALDKIWKELKLARAA